MPFETQAVPFARGASKRDPFAIKLSEEKRTKFIRFICDEIVAGEAARSRHMANGGLLDTWHAMYEQAERPRDPAYPDAADLASWLPTEKTDALKARLVQIVFGVDPICAVEGWGEKPERASLVEAFHQWKAEDERLREWLDRGILMALIEGNGILEVSEQSAIRKTKSQGRFMPEMLDGVMQMSDQGLPIPAYGEDGKLVKYNPDSGAPALDLTYEERTLVCAGPQYDVISLKDFLFLPAHAKNQRQVWGRAKRIFRRLPELQYAAKQGVYDKAAVERLGTHGERESTMHEIRRGISIAPQDGPTAEKELWEVQLLYDIDDDGIEEWLIATVSVAHDELLRVQYDDLKQVRNISITPYPDPESVYGFSFVGNKLWTITEEHTAFRNMAADGTALAVSAPVMRLQNALWQPDQQPWGARAVIDVRDLREIQQMQVKDVPSSVFAQMARVEQAAERITGLNDTAVVGTIGPGEKPTLGQQNQATSASFVRVEDPLHFVQGAMADLYQLRQRIYIKQYQADPKGFMVPQERLIGVDTRGMTLPKDGPFAITADMLDGDWKFVPKGAADASDKGHQLANFAQFLQALPALFQLSPAMAQQVAMNPKIGEALLQHAFRLFGMRDLYPLLSTSGPPQMAPGMTMGMGQDPMATLVGALGGSMGAPPAPPQGLLPPMALGPEGVQ